MKIKSLVPWYGSKRTLAPRIVQQFGPHHSYFNPCCGSLAFELVKEPCRLEVVSDLHDDLLNLIRVLCDRDSAECLHGFLSLVPYSEAIYLDAVERLAGTYEDPLLRARDYMIASWMGINGLCGTDRKVSFARRFTSNGGNGTIRWQSMCDSLPYWHRRIRNIEFHQRCMFTTLDNVPDENGVVICVDPPYLTCTRSHNARYRHEFAAADHQRLAKRVGQFRAARVLVCYYRTEQTDELYRDWKRIDFPGHKNMSNFGSAPTTERSDAQECVYINCDIYPEA